MNWKLNQFQPFHFFVQFFAHLCWRAGNNNSSFFESIDFVLSATLSARDDGTFCKKTIPIKFDEMNSDLLITVTHQRGPCDDLVVRLNRQ